MDTTLPAVAEELLKEVEKVFHETSHVPDDHLRAHPTWRRVLGSSKVFPLLCDTEVGHNTRLKFIFGASAVSALDLVDCQAVTRIVSPSGRTVYQVLGSSRKLYRCYSSCHFCPCPSFAFSVLRKGDSLVCKHLLAIYLSQAMGTCQELTVPDKQLTRLLLPEEGGG